MTNNTENNVFITELYHEYKNYVFTMSINAAAKYKLLMSREFPGDPAAELSQECWATVAEMMGKAPYDPAKSARKTWLVMIFRNTVSRILQKHRATKRCGTLIPIGNFDPLATRTDTTVKDLLDMFSGKEKIIMKWLYVDDFSREDICQKFNISQRVLGEIEADAISRAKESVNYEK